MMSKNAKRKILTAAVLCACTTLWASPVWAATGGFKHSDGAYYGERKTSSNGLVEGEEVTIETGDSFKGVYGGYAFEEDGWGEQLISGTSQANGSAVTINGGNILGGKLGGLRSQNGVVAGGWANYTSNNTVTINDGEIQTSVYGGYSMVSGNENEEHPEISGNKVYVIGGTVTGGDIAGAYVTSDGDDGNKNIIKNNMVTIDGGSITTDDRGDYGNVYGAYSEDRYSVLTDNKVVINGGYIKTEDGSLGGVYGAYASKKYNSAIANIVEINDGIIEGNVYGAFAYTGNSDSDESGEVRDNKVIIKGGTIIGDVYAGRSQQGTNLYNNSIEIYGNNADLSQANLYGWSSNDLEENCGIVLNVNDFDGQVAKVEHFNDVNIINNSNLIAESINLSNDYYYNGDLNLENSSLKANTITGITKIDIQNSELITDQIDHFDYLEIVNNNQKNIELGTVEGWEGGDYSTIITDSKFTADSIKDLKELNVDMSYINWEKDTAVVDVSGTADFTGTSISASGTLAAAAGTEVQNGDRMSFIKAGELKGVSAADVDIDKLQIGFATEAKVEMQDDGNSIDFVITGAQQANEQAGIIGESRTAAIAFVNQGSDILNNAFGLMDDGKYGIKTFAAAHGNYSKYETGSHIRVNGWSMIAGVGNSDKLEDGTFSWGVFFENGSGNYRTYNDYNGYNLRGFGSAVYNGGGALARYRSNAGNYAEVGLRAGMLKNSLGNAVADGYGVQGGYDEETSYYGAHLGVGHIFAVDENSNVDVYGKYFYNHHESEDLNILGDEVRFDSADSNRLRLGLRYNQNDGNAFSHYYGLAWDYEFSGDANVTAAGFDTGNPSLKGSTAVIEAGIHYAPDNSPWSIDLGLQGYGGQRDGFSGTMQLNYSFN